MAKTASETGGGLHGKPSGSPAQAVRCAGHRLLLPPFPLTQRCPPARAHPFSGKHGLRRRGSLFPVYQKEKQWISRTLLKNVQRQLKKVPDYDIVLPHNPLQHEVLEAMKRFFQNRQYDVLVSLRQLLLTAAVLCLFCIPCFAGEWSVSLGMNGGDADTITGDLSLRYTLNPFYGNDMLEIRPLIECAGVYWKRITMLSGEAALRAEPLWISGGKALGGLMCRGVSADSCFRQ
ncbi:MAG: hypothetical protein ACLT2T_11085 [Bilophila wadsworthia]